MTNITWIPQTERTFLRSLSDANGKPLAGERGRFSAAAEAAIATARADGFGFIGDRGHPLNGTDVPKQVVTGTAKPVTKAIPSQTGEKVDAAAVRQWANSNGVPVGLRGRLHPTVLSAYAAAHGGTLPAKAPVAKAPVVKTSKPVVTTEVARPIVKQVKTRSQTVAYGRVRRGDAPKHISEPILAITSCYSCKNPVAYCTHAAPIMPKWAGGETAFLTKAEAK